MRGRMGRVSSQDRLLHRGRPALSAYASGHERFGAGTVGHEHQPVPGLDSSRRSRSTAGTAFKFGFFGALGVFVFYLHRRRSDPRRCSPWCSWRRARSTLALEPYLASPRSSGVRSTQGQRGLDHVGEPVRDVVGRLVGLRLDHHPDQRLGAGRPQQHPAGVARARLGRRRPRPVSVGVGVGPGLVHARHVDQHLRQPGHHRRPARPGSGRWWPSGSSGAARSARRRRSSRAPASPRGRTARRRGRSRRPSSPPARSGHRPWSARRVIPAASHRVDEAEVAHHRGHHGVVLEPARRPAAASARIARIWSPSTIRAGRRPRPGSGRRRRRGRCRGRPAARPRPTAASPCGSSRSCR